MKKILIVGLLLAPTARAQIVDCPKFYPWQDTVLSEVPYQHKGKGLLTKQRLTGASLSVGEFNGGGDLQGIRKDVKGGYEVDFGTSRGPKWFVCFYGTNNVVSWWEQLDNKTADCKLKVKNTNSEGMMDATLTCK